MPTKKRFTIAPDLANGLRSTIRSASANQGQLHYDMMPTDIIEPDPANPRKWTITMDEILNGIPAETPDYQIKMKERDALNELSESIKRIGIRNAIEVYKDGLKYRIVTGERRYLAAILSGQQSVPVRIIQKPDAFNLRYTQWVENINRQDLSLWEKYNNLLLMSDAYANANKGVFTEQVLQELLGISSIQAYRYFCMLNADEKIAQLIQSGKLNNLKLIQELVSMKDKGAKNQIISWVMASKEEVTSIAQYRLASGKKMPAVRAKASQSISLGKITGADRAQQLAEIILSDGRLSKYRHLFKHVDWHSPKNISKAFKALFKSIEKEFAVEGMD